MENRREGDAGKELVTQCVTNFMAFIGLRDRGKVTRLVTFFDSRKIPVKQIELFEQFQIGQAVAIAVLILQLDGEFPQ